MKPEQAKADADFVYGLEGIQGAALIAFIG